MTDRVQPSPRVHDLGSGYTLREFFNRDRLIGYTVTGPAHPEQGCKKTERCGGLCAIRPFAVPMGEGQVKTYSIWQVTGEWPTLTFSPSVACDCGGQHGHVRDGRWV